MLPGASRRLLRLLGEEGYFRFLEAVADSFPSEVAATDAQGRVVLWNRALVRIAGSRDDVIGRPLLEALPVLREDPHLDWERAIDGALREGRGQFWPRRPLGDRVARISLEPLRATDGAILGMLLVVEDLTPGAREAERRRQHERAVAVSDLGAALAHEIRNPLNALTLNLQLLAERLPDPALSRGDISRQVDKMLADARRLEALVTHLLDVSRGQALQPSPANVSEVLRDVVERLEGTARAVQVRVHVAAESRRILQVDRLRLDRALHNLVRNAIEAAAGGGRRVWVTSRDDPHSTVVVIDDDGPGIRLEDRSAVFGLYSTGKRGGTGLGLPLALEDVRRHGGEIEVLARPGGGARFVVHLPLEAVEDVRDPGSEEA